jgi:hypothetical protein
LWSKSRLRITLSERATGMVGRSVLYALLDCCIIAVDGGWNRFSHFQLKSECDVMYMLKYYITGSLLLTQDLLTY